MLNYQQLTPEKRCTLFDLKKQGFKNAAMAKIIGVHRSTVHRELKRNSEGLSYYPKIAHRKAMKRRQRSAWKVESEPKIEEAIIEKIEQQQWSPQQMCAYYKKAGIFSVSHECVYQYLKRDKDRGGKIYKNLRHQGRYRQRRFGHNNRQGQIRGKVSIHERSKVVEERTRFGDFEIDTIVGKSHQNGIVTVVDRCTRKLWMEKVDRIDAGSVVRALRKILKSIEQPIYTITSDNGKEFALHMRLKREFGIQYYFADPYRACQRGTNENTNGLVRQYLRKGTDFKNISRTTLKNIQNIINNRPRKTLGFCSPIFHLEQLMKNLQNNPQTNN